MFVRFLSFVAVLAAFREIDAFRVLGLFPHTGKSHQMVFEPLLKTLAERGHQVTVVSFFPIKNPPANYTDVSLEGIAPIGLSVVDLSTMDYQINIVAKLLGIDGILNQMFGFHDLAPMAIDVCKKLVELPSLKETLRKKYDVVLVEYFNSDCMIGLVHAYGLHAPKIGLLSSNMMPWSGERLGLFDNPAYVSVTSTSHTSNMVLTQRIENAFMFMYFKLWFRYAIQVHEQAIIESYLGRKIPDLAEISMNTSALLANIFHELHEVRPSVPGYVEVGGMHLRRSLQEIPRFIDKFVSESEAGVILFSWGSLIKTSTITPDKEEAIVRALTKLPQRVIWKYEGCGPEGNLTGNILRVSWLPQYELLQHKKVVAFIGHGGLLGMTEAIAAGKPMVVVPFFGDQPSNGAFATRAGFATVLEYKDITEHSLTHALNTIMTAEVRLQARRISEIWRDRPMDPLDTAVYWVERVARWGHSAPLHLPARDMPFYQRALLDVIAAIILTVIVVIYVLKTIVKFLAQALLSLFREKKKKKFD